MVRIFKNLFGVKTTELPRIGTNEEMLAREFSEHIEKYAAAFIKETGLKASEVVLEQRPRMYGYHGFVYEFKRKAAPEIQHTTNGFTAPAVSQPTTQTDSRVNYDADGSESAS